MTPPPSATAPPPPAGLGRRLAALFYDGLLLTGVVFLAAIPPVALGGGEAVPVGDLAFRVYLLLVVLLYFGAQWTRGGQTLGMKTWRIRVVDAGGGALTWRQALVRFFAALASAAPLGAGFLWALADPEGRAWHDRLAGTRLVRVA